MSRRFFAMAAAAGVLAGCAPGAAAPLPPEPSVIEVWVDEHTVDYDEEVPAGRVVFRVRNAGTDEHRLALIPLPEDMPPIKEQLAGDDRRPVEPLAGISNRGPGELGIFAVDLQPGRYGLVCLATDEDGTTHARKGEATEFTIPDPSESG